jgi:SAM-dependent methyltransferase
VVGFDVSPGAIEAARRRATDGRPEFVLTGGFELPFPDDKFDLVTSFQVLEHVPDPLAYLREMARVTRPGGKVILATPNAAIRLDPGMTPWNRFHLREYTASELRDLLVGVFPQVRVRGMFGTPTLYETEIRRVDAARQRIRRKNEATARLAAGHPAASRPARVARPATPLPIRMARRLLPAPVRAWIRSEVLPARGPGRSPATWPETPPAVAQVSPPPGGPPSMDLESFLRFSVADLFYADTDLDRAMDLLAVCRLAAPRPASPTEG